MQIAADLSTIKCNYCGADVIVRDAVTLAGRVKEFTQAVAVEKVMELKPFDVDEWHKQTAMIATLIGVFGLAAAICVADTKGAGYSVAIPVAVIIVMIIVFRYLMLRKLRPSEELQRKNSKSTIVIGYRGQCPYCEHVLTIKATSLGENCPACQRRIVLRDSRFFSVETPISGSLSS